MIRLSRLALLTAILWSLSVIGVIDVGSADQPKPKMIFVHHSVGMNLIAESNVRSLIAAEGMDFWDHGYNADGLTDASGNKVEPGFDILNDNTDPDGYAAIFAQEVHNPPDNTLSHLLVYQVIVFKSCFPISDIESDSRLETYKEYYLGIRESMDRYPDRLFVVMTPPPNVPTITTSERASRGRAFATWLKSDEFLKGHPNVYTFDLFDAFAGSDNYLRNEYRNAAYPIDFTDLRKFSSSAQNLLRAVKASILGRPLYASDSHPNQAANVSVGPALVREIMQEYNQFVSQGPRSSTSTNTISFQ